MEEEKLELGAKQSSKDDLLVEDNMKMEATVDEIVEEYVGSFGFSQLLQVLLVSLAWIFDSHSTLITIFTDAQPKSWKCTSSSMSSSCGGGGGGGGDVAAVCGLKPGTWDWVDGNTTSVTAEWGLICDRRYLAAVPASLFFLGSLIGSAVYGRLADTVLGRKRTVLLSCLLTSATAFLTSLSPNLWIYALLRFANGFSRSGIGISCLVLSTEAVGRKWRGQVGQYGFFFFTVGFVSLPIIAYPTKTCWRNMYKITSLLPLLYSIFVLLPFVSESPRWLLVRGRSREALHVLKRYARFNGRQLPENLTLSEYSITSQVKRDGEETLPKMTLWGTKWAAKRMATVMFTGFGVGLVYYGIQLNVENLNFDLYFTVAVNALMEIPAVFISSVLLSFTNRRLLFSQSAYIAGASCILCVIFSSRGHRNAENTGGNWVQLAFEAIGFMAASTAFDVMYIYCVELFPTNVRNLAVSMLRQALMLGASIAPLLVVIGRLSPALSFLVCSVLSIFSGLVSQWLPETRNSPLYESLEQQEEEEKFSLACKDSGIELGK